MIFADHTHGEKEAARGGLWYPVKLRHPQELRNLPHIAEAIAAFNLAYLPALQAACLMTRLEVTSNVEIWLCYDARKGDQANPDPRGAIRDFVLGCRFFLEGHLNQVLQ